MATGDERFEEAAGIVNSVNRDFSVSNPYQAGTLYVFGNGWMWSQDDDESADETNPGAGEFRLRVAPVTDDRVMVRYMEA